MTPALGWNLSEAAQRLLENCDCKGGSKMTLGDYVASLNHVFIRRKNNLAQLLSYVLASAEPVGTWSVGGPPTSSELGMRMPGVLRQLSIPAPPPLFFFCKKFASPQAPI